MREDLSGIIESLIFVSSEPLAFEKIKTVLEDYPEEEITKALEDVVRRYEASNQAVQLTQVAGGYLFSTRSEFDPWIRRLLHVERKSRLSPAAVETLSTVAYHQPITLAQISALRGVDSSHSLKTLLTKGLVKITGRKRGPGKPLIYRTTEKFLLTFGLKSLEDLPSQEEIAHILEEEEGLD